MRQCEGKSTSPLSVCSSPRSSANRLVLPEPLAPISPMRSPGLRLRSAPSKSGFAPRASVTWEKRIKRPHFTYRLTPPDLPPCRFLLLEDGDDLAPLEARQQERQPAERRVPE